jgi:hypothetical protein
MKTHDFEQNLMNSIANTKHSSWRDVLLQKHPHIKLVKKRFNTSYAQREYKEVSTFEVPTTDGNVLMTMCSTKDEIHFYYFGFAKDETSDEDLNDMYEKYKLLKALGVKI